MLATFARLPLSAIAVDLSLPADHVPEKRHQGLAVRCLRLSPKVAPERLNVGYTPVVLVQESRVGSTENVLPAHTVGRNQYHVAGREVRLSADRHQCRRSGRPARQLPSDGTSSSFLPFPPDALGE